MRITTIGVTLLLALIFIGSLPLCATHRGDREDYSGVMLVNAVEYSKQDEKLDIGFEVEIKGEAILNYGSVLLTPKIVGSSDYLLLPNILIQGVEKGRTYQRWRRTMTTKEEAEYVAPDNLLVVDPESDTLFCYRVSVPYKSWMEGAELALNYEMTTYRDKSILTVLSLGLVIDLERDKQTSAPVITLVEAEPKQELIVENSEMELFFRQGKWVLEPSFLDNLATIEKAKQTIEELLYKKDVEISPIDIVGFTSPEGTQTLNIELAKKRALAVANRLLALLPTQLDRDDINISYYVAGWAEVKSCLKKSDIDKKEIAIDLIETTLDDRQREARIKLLDDGKVYNSLLSDIYPRLRRVDCRINYRKTEPPME